ncbi:MAG: hypothetical protein V5783_11985 [Pontiella sp.]
MRVHAALQWHEVIPESNADAKGPAHVEHASVRRATEAGWPAEAEPQFLIGEINR